MGVPINMLQLDIKGKNAGVNNFCQVFREKKEFISSAALLAVRNIYAVKSAMSYKKLFRY